MDELRALETRLIEIESRHMHQEHLLEELNQVVVAQRETIERLERALQQLRADLARGAPSEGPADEPPPHY